MNPRSRRRYVLVLALAAIPLVVAGVLLLRRAGGPPKPGGPDYEAMVSAFSEGVAALDADANDNALASLTLATKLVPEEPAAWANLGLLEIRRGDLDAAARHLEKARLLAPDSGAIEGLIGLLEGRRGDFASATTHLKRAVALDPHDDRARYALVQELDRQATPEATAEALKQMGEVVENQPDNLPALLERARLAVKAADGPALAATVALLRKQADGWPKRALDQLDTLEASAKAAPGQRSNGTKVVILKNNLVQSPAFRSGLPALQPPTGIVGDPVEHFLLMVNPSPTPSPADEALAFDVKPSGMQGTGRIGAVIATPLKGEDAPTVVAADGRWLHWPGPSDRPLAFPGGPDATSPTPDGLLALDWDSDHLLELVAAGDGGLMFYRQGPQGELNPVSGAHGLGPEVMQAPAVGVWAADVEMDGDLDVVVADRDGPPRVLRNRGNGTFEATTPFAGVVSARGFAWADLDREGTPDAAWLDAKGLVHLWRNERAGKFRERMVPAEVSPASAMAIADADGDGALDLLVLKPDGAIVRLSDRDEGRRWDLATLVAAGGKAVAAGSRLRGADLDNNGALDLIVAGPNEARVWLGTESGGFQPMAEAVRLGSAVAADLDGDGRLDLAGVPARGGVGIGKGRGAKAYRWQDVRARAARIPGDGRVNSFGIGGEIDLRSGLLVQTQAINGPIVHFGLGTHARADVLRIVWPNGTNQAEFHTKADATVIVEQRLKGSCPFIYAFNGQAMTFVTDFLWRSPLGLRINAQATAGVSQTEDWVKIRGDQLAPRDGAYEIRFTAELWETHYVDQVALMVVDHPPGTEVFVDERFSPQTPPTLDARPTGPLLPVSRAYDDAGTDVSDLVRARDGQYLDTFGRGLYQGVTRDHFVEFEVDPTDSKGHPLAKPLLVAQGWIHPTDSSLNVAIGQGGDVRPHGLSLEVLGADGSWTVARDDLGFPAGKNKTILIDLWGVLPPKGPQRLRLRTNLEIYWDALAIAEALDPAILKTRKLDPESADLRYRGFSEMTRASASSPELPDYSRLEGRAARWRDLDGFYTRFGDVRELLARVDDRYAILNAGDEIALRFPVATPPTEGWTRDFVLIGDGWNKDGDYNTEASRTVLPLPAHGQPYAQKPPDALEDDPVFRRFPADWEVYHTRHVTPRLFLNGLRPRRTAR